MYGDEEGVINEAEPVATGGDKCERYNDLDPGLLGLVLQLLAAPLMVSPTCTKDAVWGVGGGTTRLAERLRFDASEDSIVDGDGGAAPGLRLIAMPEM